MRIGPQRLLHDQVAVMSVRNAQDNRMGAREFGSSRADANKHDRARQRRRVL